MTDDAVLFAGQEREYRCTCRVMLHMIPIIVNRKKRQSEGTTLKDLIQLHAEHLRISIPKASVHRLAYKRGTQQLKPEERRVLASLVESECAAFSNEEWKDLTATAMMAAEKTSLPSIGPINWLDMLRKDHEMLAGLFQVGRTSQTDMRDLAGEYLILRKLRTGDYLVSHMSILPPASDRVAATFRTASSQRSAFKDLPFVDGLIYKSGDFLFSLGKARDASGLRAAILRPRPRTDCSPCSDLIISDLIGIRLGMGRYGDLPQAYRIWCARLPNSSPPQPWNTLVGRFAAEAFEKANTHKQHIELFDQALAWLKGADSLLLEDDDE